MNKLLHIFSLLLLVPLSAHVAAVSLADAPLVTHQEGGTASSNVMLLMGDSRSMACSSSANNPLDSFCGDDMFYAPGYDPEKVYACNGLPVLPADVNKFVVVHVSKVKRGAVSYEGVPFFRYIGSTAADDVSVSGNSGLYGWGARHSTDTHLKTPEIKEALTGAGMTRNNKDRVCFDVDGTYNAYLVALESTIDYNYARYLSVHQLDNYPIQALSGNYLNWYFSATVAEWKIKDSSGNYSEPDYSSVPARDGVNVKHWDQNVADNFILQHEQYPWGLEWDWVNGDQLNAGHVTGASTFVYPEHTDLSQHGGVGSKNPHNIGSVTNPRDKTWFPAFPIEEEGNHVNGHFIGDKQDLPEYDLATNTTATHHHGYKMTNSDLTQSHLVGIYTMMGMKPGVYKYQFRLNVAKDVAKIFVDKLDNANVAVSSFFSLVEENAGNYKVTAAAGNHLSSAQGLSPGKAGKSGAGGTLVHGFVPLRSAATEDVAIQANRISIYNAIDMVSGNHGRPTAETLVGIARYFFQGWEDENVDFVTARNGDGSIVTSGHKKLSEILALPLKNLITDTPPGYDPLKKNIESDTFCRKNAIVVFTDGVSNYDTAFDGTAGSTLLQNYDAIGVSGEPSWAGATSAAPKNSAGLVRVPGALYDHDWLPSISGIQNIETFFIHMGSGVIHTDLEKAGLAGSGGASANLFEARDGEATINAVSRIAEKINSLNSGTSSQSVAISAVTLSSVTKLKIDNYAFQASYQSEYWDGDLKAFLVDEYGQFVSGSDRQDNTVGIQPVWEAGDILAKQYILNDNDFDGVDTTIYSKTNHISDRKVYSYDDDYSRGVRVGGASGISYADLPTAFKNDLNVLANNDTDIQTRLLHYLLGDVEYEKSAPGGAIEADELFRQRGVYLDLDNDAAIDSVSKGGLLGDIVHSSPVYAAEPPRPWNDRDYGIPNALYSSFEKVQENRIPMVYIGSNAGMLHGFAVKAGSNAITHPAGREVFAYMPSILSSTASDAGFHYLANPAYEHRFYVDLTATNSDVFMDFYSADNATMMPEWRTILVGGLRKGGKGLFALDVTCPEQTSSAGNTCNDESFDASNVLWEFSSDDDADFGYSYAEPVIVKVNATPAGADRNGAATGRWAAIVSNGYNASSGGAVVFIIFLDGGLDGTWTEGSDYMKISVNSSSEGLSSATAVDYKSVGGNTHDGLTDHIYAGDLEGRLWSIDIHNQEVWSTSNVRKLFTAQANQAITTAPQIARNPAHNAAADPNLMVMIGTGRYHHSTDLTDKSLQSIYGVHDRGDSDKTISHLAQRSFDTISLNSQQHRRIREDETYGGSDYGWYINLQTDLNEGTGISAQNDGERVVFRSFIVNQTWVFNTLIPYSEGCGSSTSGWSLMLDWKTGLAPTLATYNANGSIATGGNRGIDSADQGYVGFFNAVSASEMGRGGDNIFFSTNDAANKKSVSFGGAFVNKRLAWEEHFPQSKLD